MKSRRCWGCIDHRQFVISIGGCDEAPELFQPIRRRRFLSRGHLSSLIAIGHGPGDLDRPASAPLVSISTTRCQLRGRWSSDDIVCTQAMHFFRCFRSSPCPVTWTLQLKYPRRLTEGVRSQGSGLALSCCTAVLRSLICPLAMLYFYL